MPRDIIESPVLIDNCFDFVFIRLCLQFTQNTKIIITQLTQKCCYRDEDTNIVSEFAWDKYKSDIAICMQDQDR